MTPAAEETGFYGEQPSELPETLPAGTKSRSGSVALTVVTLRPDGYGGSTYNRRGYWGRWDGFPDRDLYNTPDNINWSTVRRPAPPTSADVLHESGCCLCGRSGHSYVFERCNGPHRGKRICNQCLIQYDGGLGVGAVNTEAEITRRKSLATRPAKDASGSEPATVRKDKEGQVPLPSPSSGPERPTADPWGIPRQPEPPVDRIAAMRATLTCAEPGCRCPYCIHRAHSPKLGANDPRYNAGKGPHYGLQSEPVGEGREARGPWDWDSADAPENIVS